MSSNTKKKIYKVKRFKPEWLQKTFDDVKVSTWLIADPSDPKKGKCTVCPAPSDSPFSGRSFSIAEGISAIRSHSKSKTHQKAVEEPNNNEEDPMEQMRIEQALRNQEELSRKDRKEQKAILHGQVAFANMLHYHGVPSPIFTCFAKLAPTMFHGLYPYQLQKLIKQLKKDFFSLNFDETSINLNSQLDINVSYLSGDVIVKENLTTISMESGTTAEEIVDAVIGQLEEFLIPLENIMVVTTDGCSTILGSDNGVHTLMR
jgi:hypothetical protein